jgi:pimeloyl-ACP methyl ester carboxylesterase
MPQTSNQPIVFLGGFLSYAMLYESTRDALARVTGQPVFVVETYGHDWLAGVSRIGWARVLRKLAATVQQALAVSITGRVTVVGHSAGGVFARLYLSPRPFLGRAYRGVEYVDHLITLGSPHYNKGGVTRGGHVSRWLERRYPGAYFSPQVTYSCVAGKAIQGDERGSTGQRWAYRFYRQIEGQGDIWGDGLVPVSSALLRGAQHITLVGVSHFHGFGEAWYGSEEVISRWWGACIVPDKMVRA